MRKVLLGALAALFALGSAGAVRGAVRASGAPRELDDATIVAIFDAANTFDMETGALAKERGASEEVRSFGAMLVHDHEMVRQQGRDLAARLKVTPTPPEPGDFTRDHLAAMKRLRAISQRRFDQAFLLNEVKYHKTVIDLVNSRLLPAIQNAELRKLVVDVAPAFQAHMAAADALQKKLAKRPGK